jgi:hypothetical protein
MTLHSVVIFIATLLMSLMVASCSKKIEESPAYQAACQGSPLRTDELRNKAMEDGYDINRQYDCIDKASYVAVAEDRAKWAAANTPEAIAKREAEFAEQKARYAEQRERERKAEASRPAEAWPMIILRDVDVNIATEEDIANVISVGPKVAAQIIEERNKRRFNDWADLVHRVIGLSAAQTAYYASICGLNVDGKSLDGAPPDARMAASIYQKYRQYQQN